MVGVCKSEAQFFNNPRIAQIDQQISDCRLKIATLQREEEQALDELRNGLFCSKCNRSKSELERVGINFGKHLSDVKGQAVAHPELYAEKKTFYEDQIAALQRRIAELEGMKSQVANAARQQADLERQRQQREQQGAQLREMQAQADRLKQQRDAIVNRAVSKAEATQRAGQAAADGIRQIGEVLLQQMERDRQEKEQQRAQERIDRQLEQLEERMKEQERSANQNPGDSPSNREVEGDLPPPVQLVEPPGEREWIRQAEQQIRTTGVAPTVTFRDGTSFSSNPAYDPNHGAVGPTIVFGRNGEQQAYKPETKLSELINPGGDGDRGAAPERRSPNGDNPVNSIFDSLTPPVPVGEKPRSPSGPGNIFDQTETPGGGDRNTTGRNEAGTRRPSDPGGLFSDTEGPDGGGQEAKPEDNSADSILGTIQQQYNNSMLNGVIQKAKEQYNEFVSRPQPMLGGKTWTDIPPEERLFFQLKYDLLRHMWYVARRKPNEAVDAGNDAVGTLGQGFELFQNGNGGRADPAK